MSYIQNVNQVVFLNSFLILFVSRSESKQVYIFFSSGLQLPGVCRSVTGFNLAAVITQNVQLLQ